MRQTPQLTGKATHDLLATATNRDTVMERYLHRLHLWFREDQVS